MMKVALVSDIHGNYPYLLKALAQIDKKDCEQLWCLGDTVGWPGDDHLKCLEELVDRQAVIIAGNHDAVATGNQPAEYFAHLPDIYQKAINARDQLQMGDGRAFWWLQDLEPIMAKPLGNCKSMLCHGHPIDPYWAYISSAQEVVKAIEMIRGLELLVCGHSHKAAYGSIRKPQKDDLVPPLGVFEAKENKLYREGLEFNFNTHRYMINPGSVGADRTGHIRYAILECDDTETPIRATWHKISV